MGFALSRDLIYFGFVFTFFVRNSSRHVYNDCSIKKQPISTAVVVFEFSELLNELQKHIETLASYLNM